MYRNIILEFLSSKHLELSSNNYFQMTICQLGQNYDNQLLKLVKSEDIVTVYHIKEPRIYQKDISFDDLKDNIVMMAIDLKEEIRFNKTELNFVLKDPFYLKDLQNQSFSSLVVSPIIENDNVIGVVITYYNKENGYVKFTNNELLKLINNLTIDLCFDYEENIKNTLLNVNNLLLLASNNKYYYINDAFQKYYNIDNKILNIVNNKYNDIIQNFIGLLGVNKVIKDKLNIYYINELKLKECKETPINICPFSRINDIKIDEKFTFIFVRKNLLSSNNNIYDIFLTIVNKLDCIEYKIYEYSEDAMVLIINKIINSKDIIKINNMFNDDYVIVLQGSKDITNSMNFKQLVAYLISNLPTTFDIKDYINYLNKNNEEKLTYNDKFNFNKFNYEIINSSNASFLAELSNLPLRKSYRLNHYDNYISSVEREISLLTKEVDQKLFITIPLKLLKKRKVFEDIKKIIENNELWINVISNNEYSSIEFLKLISKYKKLRLMLCCDSSIYLNYFYMNSLPLFDAFYVLEEEYNHIRQQEVGLPQLIFDYAIKNYKYIIFENFSPNSDYDFNHFNCYFVRNKDERKRV